MHKVQALTRLYAVVGNQSQCAAACLLVPYLIHAVYAPMRKKPSLVWVWGEVMGEGTLGPHPTPFFLLSYRAIKRGKFQCAWKAILPRIFHRMRSCVFKRKWACTGSASR
jgi:hypothetical protein